MYEEFLYSVFSFFDTMCVHQGHVGYFNKSILYYLYTVRTFKWAKF